MPSLTIFYVIVVILVMVAAVLFWVMSSRSRQNSTVWLMGLGVLVLIGAGVALFGAASNWDFSGLSQKTKPVSEESANTDKPGPDSRTASTKWADLQRLAPGLLPNCFQGAGLNNAWNFVVTPQALVVAFVLLTEATATKYQKVCKEPNLGTPQKSEAFVAVFAQANEPARLELNKITFLQDQKSYNVSEYLIDDQRSENERWVTTNIAWLPISGSFPQWNYFFGEMASGPEGRSIGLIALPTGIIQDKTTHLDPDQAFEVNYDGLSLTITKP
jgi:hypothetical protein